MKTLKQIFDELEKGFHIDKYADAWRLQVTLRNEAIAEIKKWMKPDFAFSEYHHYVMMFLIEYFDIEKKELEE